MLFRMIAKWQEKIFCKAVNYALSLIAFLRGVD
ncbi:hypothetical protein PGN_1508 [Porphyromonas gingivalis ATCC 33277]|uniref:Uncharacterized protein n=1 Tax=Porphyromonas gingivalis (strain ATCC 33277 / DSM 20709 / CIP 103683 / JCM 12257 / NCTC 11834 / 2561) TaxID=431947 RepID=B2RKY2_PORG3|nr:hypothetical protein PGN_1508 [Porphyromonas gingivalis ATCC 33277]